jgi:hypothetical protein
MSVVVLGWSINYFINLAMRHNTGPELCGVLVAALSIGAAVANIVMLRSSRVQLVPTAALFVLWAVVALGGIAGTYAHIVGPVAGHGRVDLRPRLVAAPLVFTILGSVGALALFLGQRIRIRATESGKGY